MTYNVVLPMPVERTRVLRILLPWPPLLVAGFSVLPRLPSPPTDAPIATLGGAPNLRANGGRTPAGWRLLWAPAPGGAAPPWGARACGTCAARMVWTLDRCRLPMVEPALPRWLPDPAMVASRLFSLSSDACSAASSSDWRDLGGGRGWRSWRVALAFAAAFAVGGVTARLGCGRDCGCGCDGG